MSEIETRLEALKLAHSHASGIDAVLQRAQAYEDWLRGPAKSQSSGGTLSLPPGRKGPIPPKGAG